MKSKLRPLYLSLFFVALTITFSVSCSKSLDDLTTTCVNASQCGKTYKICTNISGGGGYYEYNGIKYTYTLTTISDAASRLVAAMCK